MTDFSNPFRQAVNAQETGEKFIFLVTIEHPDLPAPLRINNSVKNIVSRGLPPFLASFLQVKILDQDPARSPQAQITISNIKREIVAALRSTPIPCLITLEIVRGSDHDTVEQSMTNLEMRSINYDEMVIQGDLMPRRLRPRKAIDYYFTPSTAPGLF
jgi:hypothetical protein